MLAMQPLPCMPHAWHPMPTLCRRAGVPVCQSPMFSQPNCSLLGLATHRVAQDGLGSRLANSINVLEGDLDPLPVGNLNVVHAEILDPQWSTARCRSLSASNGKQCWNQPHGLEICDLTIDKESHYLQRTSDGHSPRGRERPGTTLQPNQRTIASALLYSARH